MSRIRRQVEKTGTKILAWALMDTHIHLLNFSGTHWENLWGQALDIWISNKSSRILFINRFRSLSVCASCSSTFGAVLNVEESR